MITLSSEKFKQYLINLEGNVEELLKSYSNYIDSNSFNDLKCPNCKNTNCLFFHKTYKRNLCYYENEKLKEIIINIAVLKCNICSRTNNQKYHALLPDFVLPYHIYEASTIISNIYDYLIKRIKLEKILGKLMINHKLFYNWINKIKKYNLASSVILKIKDELFQVVEQIYLLNQKFLIEFYSIYNHPYFLFKKTCVPLCQIP